MILSSLLTIFFFGCILFWHRMRIRQQATVHEQRMLLLDKKLRAGKYANKISKDQIRISEDMLKSIRRTNNRIGRDVYSTFLETLEECLGKRPAN